MTTEDRADALEAKGKTNRKLIDIVFAGVIVALAVCAVGAIVAGLASRSASHASHDATAAVRRANAAVAKVAQIEQRDRDASRATAYRLCARNASDRAFAHASMRGLLPKRQPPRLTLTPHEKRIRVVLSRTLMEPPYLPILNCKPNLRGRGAEPWPVRRQEQFMRKWVTARLSGVERGVCPNSVIGAPPPVDTGRC